MNDSINILYIPGFAGPNITARFNPRSAKIVALGEIGNVFGISVNYSKNLSLAETDIEKSILLHKIDLVVGTSMGGWLAQREAPKYGLPFVAINPAIEPHITLKERVPEEIIEQYEAIGTSGYGLILLDSDDEIFDSEKTFDLLNSVFEVHMFKGGNHRFYHMLESTNDIVNFYNRALHHYS